MTSSTALPATTTPSPGRFIFEGHAIGAAAHFHKLDDATGLNIPVPAQAVSALPPTGGLSQASVANFAYTVPQPRQRTLLSVGAASSKAEGRTLADRWETEVEVDLTGFWVVQKLRIDQIRLHMLSTFMVGGSQPVVSTTGSKLEGVWLDNVQARITLDDEPLTACGSDGQLAAFFWNKSAAYRNENDFRFKPAITSHGVIHKSSLVKKIELVGSEVDKAAISVDGYTIYWHGFGKIILGEIHVKGNSRQVSMVRLALGSDGGGTGTGGSGQSNGQGPTG